MIRIILLSLLLTSCVTIPPQDHELQPYLETFRYEAIEVRKVPVFTFGLELKFVDSYEKPETVGQCTIKGPFREITIKREFWTNASECQKEYLMFHEFGHCVLFRTHRTSVESGRPVSLMYPNIDTAFYCDEEERTAYLNELFENRNLMKVEEMSCDLLH